jgi:hypothetical protein
MRSATPVLLALATAVSLPAAASDIYKCVDGASTSYQSAPCPQGRPETRIYAGPMIPRQDARVKPQAQAEPSAPVVVVRPEPWRHQTLTLGMSDDEVLNMPQWGRPSRITRVRTPRAWQETWTYSEPLAGERQLLFVNAKLADIIDQPAPRQVAQLGR